MRRLVDSCGETVNIYIRQDTTRMSIAQQQGTHTVRNVVEVGTPMPLSGGSAAKVLLTAAPKIIDELGQLNPNLDTAQLRAEVDEARRAGFAVSHGEREEGASAVSAPIVGADGRVLAALCISGSQLPADRGPVWTRPSARPSTPPRKSPGSASAASRSCCERSSAARSSGPRPHQRPRWPVRRLPTCVARRRRPQGREPTWR